MAPCRDTKRCNVWFWCSKGADGACYEELSQTKVPDKGCALLAVPLQQHEKPEAVPEMTDHIRSSYVRGYEPGEPTLGRMS